MKAKKIVLVAVFAAITAVFSQISIPLPFSPIPFTLSILAVFLCGALLDEKHAFLAQLVYLCIGAVGIPVFSGFGGGIAKLVGPTGGYLVTYPLMAFLVAFALRKTKKKTLLCYLGGMAAALGICYLIGTLWLSYLTNVTFVQGLAAGVYPFVFFDCVKIVLASVLSMAVSRSLDKAKVRL